MNERHFRLYERIVAIEDSLEALGPIDKLIERIEELEKMVKQTKTVLGFDEACKLSLIHISQRFAIIDSAFLLE